MFLLLDILLHLHWILNLLFLKCPLTDILILMTYISRLKLTSLKSSNIKIIFNSDFSQKKKNSLPMRLYTVIRKWTWTSLVVQWIRIWLLMQGAWVQSWSRKSPHATEQPSPFATTTEPECCTTEALATRACAPSKRSHRGEKPAPCDED